MFLKFSYFQIQNLNCTQDSTIYSTSVFLEEFVEIPSLQIFLRLSVSGNSDKRQSLFLEVGPVRQAVCTQKQKQHTKAAN